MIAISLAAMSAATDGAFSLRWKPKEGDAITYSTEATFDVGGTQASIKSKTLEKVLKVDADGTYSVQSSTLEGMVTYLGQQIPLRKPITVTLYRPTGEVVSITGDDINAVSYRSANLTMLRRPENPVNVLDKWSTEIKGDPKLGSIGMKGSYTVEAEEKVGEFDTLRVTAVNKEQEGTDAGTVEATFWINKADGSVIKTTAKWTNVTFPGAPAPVSGTITTTRVAG